MSSKAIVAFRWTSSDLGQAFQSHGREQMLSITRITTLDVGNYTCVASTAKRAGSATVMVQVLKPSTHHTTTSTTDQEEHSENPASKLPTYRATSTEQQSDEDPMTRVIIGGAVGGGLMLLVIVALSVAVIILVRRQSQTGNILWNF